AAIQPRLQMNFGDARKIPPDLIRILFHGRPEFVQVDLLEEIEVRRGSLTLVRITSIEDACPISVPRCAAPGGRTVDPRHNIRKFLSGFGVVKMERSPFASFF